MIIEGENLAEPLPSGKGTGMDIRIEPTGVALAVDSGRLAVATEEGDEERERGCLVSLLGVLGRGGKGNIAGTELVGDEGIDSRLGRPYTLARLVELSIAADSE